MSIFDKFFKKNSVSPSKGIVDTKEYKTKNFVAVKDPQSHLASGREELYQMIAQSDDIDTSKS